MIIVLLGNSAALGYTVLASIMSVIALSLPETIILGKVLSIKLIAVFVGSGMLGVGFLLSAQFFLKGQIMKDIRLLGPGCKRYDAVAAVVTDSAAAMGLDLTIEMVSDYTKIADYGVASTPGIVVNGKVVHAGGSPKEGDLKRWLQA